MWAPTLRERRGDVELLARYFFNKFSAEVKTVAKGFNRDALEVISRYDWPGNVRELMNRVRRGVLLTEGPYISPSDMELERRSLGRGFVTLDEARMAADREVIQATLLADPVQYRPRRPGVERLAHDPVPFDGEVRHPPPR